MTAFHSSPRMLGQKQDKFWLTVGLCALAFSRGQATPPDTEA